MTESASIYSRPSTCTHEALAFEPSSYAVEVGYERPTAAQREAACLPSGRLPKTATTSTILSDPATFPAALVLPDDDLALDPSYPPQSLLSWTREKDRNKVTSERKTIYIAAPPDVNPDVAYIQKWSDPQTSHQRTRDTSLGTAQMRDIVEYLSAFYHGLPVQQLHSSKLHFGAWGEDTKLHRPPRRGSKFKPVPYIALNSLRDSTRIRVRASPSGVYTHQLNLNDLLDAAISLLPEDAYALLLLTSHDLYEDDDDDFVCGRAYGGSRIAVVSTARYHPALDEIQGVERLHMWPASHCNAYLQDQTRESQPKQRRGVAIPKKKTSAPFKPQDQSPMTAALQAHQKVYNMQAPSALTSLLAYRVARTASHELAHCFGLDHCVYFACIMQGSASIQEDARQPPYLCPVDLAKLLRATGTTEVERDRKLLEFCERKGGTWSTFAAWLEERQRDSGGNESEKVVIVIDD